MDSATILDRFLADHRRLEVLLEDVMAAFEANDRENVARLWTLLDTGLLAHIEAEETYMIPALARTEPVAARTLLDEHQQMRNRLTELAVGVDLHLIRLDHARTFIEELRAHAAEEDQMLYRWADEHLDEGLRSRLLGLVGKHH